MAAPTNLQQYQAQLQANQAALGQQLLLPPQREYRSYHYHRRGVGTSGVAITAPFSVARGWWPVFCFAIAASFLCSSSLLLLLLIFSQAYLLGDYGLNGTFD
jgi:hypothetical protein